MRVIQFTVPDETQAEALLRFLKTIPYVGNLYNKKVKKEEYRFFSEKELDQLSQFAVENLRDIWDNPEEDKIWSDYDHQTKNK